jgi:hypothetical protein
VVFLSISGPPSTQSCEDFNNNPDLWDGDGVYTIEINGTAVNIYCKGPETLIQRRSVGGGLFDFDRGWAEYGNGFDTGKLVINCFEKSSARD